MSKLPDSISIVGISREARDAALAALQMQGVVDPVMVASLVEIAIKTTVAEKEPAQMYLEALAVTKAAAETHQAGTVMNMDVVVVSHDKDLM